MKKKKIGKVLLKEIKPNKFTVAWHDKRMQKYERHVLPYTQWVDAQQEAEKINLRLASQNGYTSGAERIGLDSPHTIRDAVLEAIRASDGNELTKRDYIGRYNCFVNFLKGRRAQYWSDVTEKLLQDYLVESREAGLAFDTIRLRFCILRLTANYMARTYPMMYRKVTDGLKLRRKDPPRSLTNPEEEIPSAEQFRSLLKWLKEHEPMLYVWACLQGLAGLRMLEAVYLREQDIDFENQTISIANSAVHKPKTGYSYRTIPVCKAIMDALRVWVDSDRKRHKDGFLFVVKRRNYVFHKAKDNAVRNGCLSTDYASRLYSDAMRQARKDGLELPKRFIPRKLRATFITAMRGKGADFADLQIYVGQAPVSVLSIHYDHVSIDRLRKIAELAE